VDCGAAHFNADVLFDTTLLFNDNDDVFLSVARENVLALE
jgi:hypothetical protein